MQVGEEEGGDGQGEAGTAAAAAAAAAAAGSSASGSGSKRTCGALPGPLAGHQMRSMATRAGGEDYDADYDAATWQGCTRGPSMRTPAAPLPLPLQIVESLRQSATVAVLNASSPLLLHKVAGKQRSYHKLAHLLTYGPQLVLILHPPATFAEAGMAGRQASCANVGQASTP